MYDLFYYSEGPRSAGWRDHNDRRRKFDFEMVREEGGAAPRGSGRDNGPEDDRDGLPEWCMEDEDDEMGTFDSSGAFLSFKVLRWLGVAQSLWVGASPGRRPTYS